MTPGRPDPGSSVVARLAPLLPVLLFLGGFGCIVAAAFTVAVWAGLVAAGVSCLALEYVLSGRAE